MVSADIIKKFVAQIKEKHRAINEPTIEKDFYLTFLLNEISKCIDEDDKSPFSKLVFKGGTLLTRTHLNYHRISEDLDCSKWVLYPVACCDFNTRRPIWRLKKYPAACCEVSLSERWDFLFYISRK